jgi:hypothetical protein
MPKLQYLRSIFACAFSADGKLNAQIAGRAAIAEIGA